MEKTYIDLIIELRNSINSDVISREEKEEIILHLNIIADILWKYFG